MHTGHFEDAVTVNAAATYVAPRPGGPGNDNVYPLHNRYLLKPFARTCTSMHHSLILAIALGVWCVLSDVKMREQHSLSSIENIRTVSELQGVSGLGAPHRGSIC